MYTIPFSFVNYNIVSWIWPGKNELNNGNLTAIQLVNYLRISHLQKNFHPRLIKTMSYGAKTIPLNLPAKRCGIQNGFRARFHFFAEEVLYKAFLLLILCKDRKRRLAVKALCQKL